MTIKKAKGRLNTTTQHSTMWDSPWSERVEKIRIQYSKTKSLIPCVSNSKNTRLLVKLCTRGELEESGLYGTPETEKEERENAKKNTFCHSQSEQNRYKCRELESGNYIIYDKSLHPSTTIKFFATYNIKCSITNCPTSYIHFNVPSQKKG